MFYIIKYTILLPLIIALNKEEIIQYIAKYEAQDNFLCTYFFNQLFNQLNYLINFTVAVTSNLCKHRNYIEFFDI